MSKGPFHADLTKVNYLTERTWIENTIRSCHKYNITIESSITGLHKWTDRDECIMDRALRKIKGKELRIFNKVRLYLQVATTSDIANADGNSIDREILRVKRSTSPSPSAHAYKWPHIPAPASSEVRIWSEALCRIYNNTEGNRTLDYNNYRWFHFDCVDKVSWNFDVGINRVYQKTGESWIQWDACRPNARTTRSRATYKKPTPRVTKMHLVTNGDL